MYMYVYNLCVHIYIYINTHRHCEYFSQALTMNSLILIGSVPWAPVLYSIRSGILGIVFCGS